MNNTVPIVPTLVKICYSRCWGIVVLLGYKTWLALANVFNSQKFYNSITELPAHIAQIGKHLKDKKQQLYATIVIDNHSQSVRIWVRCKTGVFKTC